MISKIRNTIKLTKNNLLQIWDDIKKLFILWASGQIEFSEDFSLYVSIVDKLEIKTLLLFGLFFFLLFEISTDFEMLRESILLFINKLSE